MKKLAELDLSDQIYHCLADFFTGHVVCTVYCGQTSTLKTITASIIQGSAIGPAAYVVTASDLKARGNQLKKFADDTYLMIPTNNVDSRTAEVENIEARTNDLTLNRGKTKEIMFTISEGVRLYHRRKWQILAVPRLRKS
jgi:Reverse transcriptase (RNA-dependent DNA polymerase)